MTTTKNTSYITEILQHDISWFVEADEVTELDSVSIEYIEKLITDGYSSGQLCISYGRKYDKETIGWWHIVNWKSIALEFYNANNETKRANAIKKFDENWG